MERIIRASGGSGVSEEPEIDATSYAYDGDTEKLFGNVDSARGGSLKI